MSERVVQQSEREAYEAAARTQLEQFEIQLHKTWQVLNTEVLVIREMQSAVQALIIEQNQPYRPSRWERLRGVLHRRRV